MLKVGITGGIGSGKSLVSGIFALLGIPVYDSDHRAKEIMQGNANVRHAIKDAFGDQTYDKLGILDRKYIASRVFEDSDQLATLNAIVHPAVATDFEAWCDAQRNTPYILKEAALIFEAGINVFLDKVILVHASEELRVARVMQRDGVDEESVRARIKNQWSDDKKALLSDFIIVNDGDQSLLRQTLEFHNFLLQCTQIPVK